MGKKFLKWLSPFNVTCNLSRSVGIPHTAKDLESSLGRFERDFFIVTTFSAVLSAFLLIQVTNITDEQIFLRNIHLEISLSAVGNIVIQSTIAALPFFVVVLLLFPVLVFSLLPRYDQYLRQYEITSGLTNHLSLLRIITSEKQRGFAESTQLVFLTFWLMGVPFVAGGFIFTTLIKFQNYSAIVFAQIVVTLAWVVCCWHWIKVFGRKYRLVTRCLSILIFIYLPVVLLSLYVNCFLHPALTSVNADEIRYYKERRDFIPHLRLSKIVVNDSWNAPEVDEVGLDLSEWRKGRLLFEGGSFRYAELSGVQINGIDFSAADFSGADFTSPVLKFLAFLSSKFIAASFSYGHMPGTVWFDTDLTSSEFKGVRAGGTFSQRTIFKDVRIEEETWMPASVFFATDFEGSTFGSFVAPYSRFQNVSLRGSRFFEADLRGSNFYGVDFIGTSMCGTSLSRATFSSPMFEGTVMLQLNGSLSPVLKDAIGKGALFVMSNGQGESPEQVQESDVPSVVVLPSEIVPEYNLPKKRWKRSAFFTANIWIPREQVSTLNECSVPYTSSADTNDLRQLNIQSRLGLACLNEAWQKHMSFLPSNKNNDDWKSMCASDLTFNNSNIDCSKVRDENPELVKKLTCITRSVDYSKLKRRGSVIQPECAPTPSPTLPID